MGKTRITLTLSMRRTMTKQDIINEVSLATGLTKVETEAVMNGVMTSIIESLAKNERVELRGFGTFVVKHRKPKKHGILERVHPFIYQKEMHPHSNPPNICGNASMIF